MTTRFESVTQELAATPRKWLVTGCAGFIGSNLLETLLKLNQTVTGLDNFATGHQRNLDEVKASVTPEQWARLTFIEGDIRDLEACRRAVQGVDFVLHQAALGSVPRSLKDPITTNEVNIEMCIRDSRCSACRRSPAPSPRPPAAATTPPAGRHGAGGR